jgi:hypothetical protein
MGKYERGKAELLERNYAEQIGATFHGNKSFDIGDLTLESGEIIEIKSSKNGNSFGTLANIGQNSLTKYKLFNTISWEDYREKNNFNNFKLNIFKNYEEWSKFTKIIFVKNIKNILKKEDFELIANKNSEIVFSYLEMLEKEKQNNENIKIFYLNMINGRHSNKNYDDKINNINDKFLTIRIDENGKEKKVIKYFFDPSFIYEIKFEKITKNVFLCARKEDVLKKLLRIVFHWKNKGQGIQTPCLNIFYINKEK